MQTLVGTRAGREIVSAAAAVGILLMAFLLGAMTVRKHILVPVLIGVAVCYVVYRTGSQRMAWIGLVAAFAALPNSIPTGKPIGQTTIYVSEFFLILAILYLIPIYRRRVTAPNLRRINSGLYLLFVGWVIFFSVVGLVNKNPWPWIIFDARNLLVVAFAAVFGYLLVACDLSTQTMRVITYVLWFSAAMTVLSTVTGLELRGRGGAELTDVTGAHVSGVERVITSSHYLAVAVMTALIVWAMCRGVSLRTWLQLGVPALLIVLLGFSRNSVLAVGVAFIAGLVLNWNKEGVRAVFRVVVVSLVSLVLFVAALKISGAAGFGGWLNNQVNAFYDRVFGGLARGGEGDTSWQFRVDENRALFAAIKENPLLGHGFGYAYQRAYGAPDSFTATAGPYYAHNYYLWLLVKSGIVGLCTFLWFAGSQIAIGLRSPRLEAKTSAVVALTLAIIAYVWPVPNGTYDAPVFGIALGASVAFARFGTARSGQSGTADESEPQHPAETVPLGVSGPTTTAPSIGPRR